MIEFSGGKKMYLTFPQRMIKIANKTRWLIILLVLLVIKLFPEAVVDYTQIYFLLILAGIYNLLVRFIPWQQQWQEGKGYRICYAESTLDIIFISGIIYLTGGLQSNFFLLYFAVIMFAATYYNPLKCFLITICISLLYILNGILTEPSLRVLLSTLLSKIPLLFAIAGVTVYLTQEIKIQSEELELEKEKLQKLLQRLKGNLKEIDKKNQMLNEIYKLSLKIGSSLNLEDELNSIIDVTNEFLKSDLILISLVDENKQELEFKAKKGNLLSKIPDVNKIKIEESILGQVIRTGQPVSISDLSKIDSNDRLFTSKKGISSLLSVPLIVNEKPIGVFTCVYSKVMEFKEDEVKFLSLIATRAALSINNAQLHDEIRKLAITDGLTGLYNYRYFQESLKREIERCKRIKSSLSLLMIDIDHFKDFNDTYGHQEGDILLSRLAMLLNYHIRQTDIIARYGGEEFVIIATDISLGNTFLLGERIRHEIEKGLLTEEDAYRLKTTLPVTISIGIAVFPADALEQKELIKCADTALYEAKNTGRNRVVEYGKIM
ncbi:MAG: sensor domain-containing diguanylate cyclase [bacterium]